jgi:hypothetical protein
VDLDHWRGAAPPRAWRPPEGAQVFAGDARDAQCVGEMSVIWIEPMELWLALYNCGGEILARVAAAPWGPWSAPTDVLSSADPGMSCVMVMDIKGCPNGPPDSHRDYWPGKHDGWRFTPGSFYAPYVMGRYTSVGPGLDVRTVQVFWLVSPWNPYETMVVRTTFRLPAPPIPRPPLPHPPPARPGSQS